MASGAAEAGSDEAAVRRSVQEFGDALGRGDFAAVLEMVDEGAVFWPDAAPETRGRDTLRAAYERMSGYRFDARFDVEEVVLGGDLALVRGYEHFRLEPRAGGDALVIAGRRAFSVWRRTADGTWKNTHGMTNWPAPASARG